MSKAQELSTLQLDIPNKLARTALVGIALLVALLLILWVAYMLTPQQRAIRTDRKAFRQLSIPSNWKPSPCCSGEDDSNFFKSLFVSAGVGYRYDFDAANMSKAQLLQQTTKMLSAAGYQLTFETVGGYTVKSLASADGIRAYNAKPDVTIDASPQDNHVSFDVMTGGINE